MDRKLVSFLSTSSGSNLLGAEILGLLVPLGEGAAGVDVSGRIVSRLTGRFRGMGSL